MDAPKSLGSAAVSSKRLGGGTEQDFVDDSRILKRQISDLLGQGEQDMEIGYGQKLRFPLLRPSSARCSLALGTMQIAA